MSDKNTNGSFQDGYFSLVSGLGDPTYDKAATGAYSHKTLSYDQVISAYRNSWLIRKLVDLPAHDAIKKWRHWQADKDLLEKIEKEERRHNLRGKLIHAYRLARLWGGAALLIGTRDEDYATPLNPAKCGEGDLTFVRVIPSFYISPGEYSTDVFSADFARPKYYDLVSNSQSMRLHPSRIVALYGESGSEDFLLGFSGQSLVKSSAKQGYYGWGDSVLQSTYDTLMRSEGVFSNIASLVFEANVDVFGVPDLSDSLSSKESEERLLRRFQIGNLSKSTTRALIRDVEEEYSRNAVDFSNLPQIMQQFMILVSGASNIPVTRYFGQSAAGMNATGEGDMKNYYDYISTLQELKLRPEMKVLDEMVLRSAVGEKAEAIDYAWAPLEEMSDRELAEIGEKNANAAKTLADAHLFEPDVLSEAVTSQLVQNNVYPGLREVLKG